MSPQTVAQLRNYGVTDSTQLKLEFFFYTDNDAKAQELALALRELGYDANVDQAAGDVSLMLVNGWTTPMPMDEATVTDWTARMCQVGFEHDCEFDGWGTNPEQ